MTDSSLLSISSWLQGSPKDPLIRGFLLSMINEVWVNAEVGKKSHYVSKGIFLFNLDKSFNRDQEIVLLDKKFHRTLFMLRVNEGRVNRFDDRVQA